MADLGRPPLPRPPRRPRRRWTRPRSRRSTNRCCARSSTTPNRPSAPPRPVPGFPGALPDGGAGPAAARPERLCPRLSCARAGIFDVNDPDWQEALALAAMLPDDMLGAFRCRARARRGPALPAGYQDRRDLWHQFAGPGEAADRLYREPRSVRVPDRPDGQAVDHDSAIGLDDPGSGDGVRVSLGLRLRLRRTEVGSAVKKRNSPAISRKAKQYKLITPTSSAKSSKCPAPHAAPRSRIDPQLIR